MKLVLAIINNDDARSVLSELTKGGFHVTKLATTGEFLKAGNTTVFVGVEQEQVEEVIQIIGEHSRRRVKETVAAGTQGELSFLAPPIQITVGGAVVFVLDVEQFIKL